MTQKYIGVYNHTFIHNLQNLRVKNFPKFNSPLSFKRITTHITKISNEKYLNLTNTSRTNSLHFHLKMETFTLLIQKNKPSQNSFHSPGQRAADDIMRVIKYTGDGDEKQRCDASFHRGLLDDAARTDGA